MSNQESISTAAFYTVATLPFDPATHADRPANGPEVCRAFKALADGTVTLTRIDGVTVDVPVTTGEILDLRFIAASGDGPILAVW